MKKYLLVLLMSFSGLFFAQNIYNGQNIEVNKKYWSANNQFYLIFQNDGNLVMYARTENQLWNSRTSGRGVKASFQDDGNLVVYGQRNNVVFSTNTSGRRADKLAIQDDGNLVIYTRTNSIWSSNADNANNGNDSGSGNSSVNLGYTFRRGIKLYSSNRAYYLSLQDDGNLVLAKNNGDPIWSSFTDNRGSKAQFQKDGNFVVYDSYNRAIWATNTANRGATKLTVQNDGNLVIYQNNSPVWSSETQR
ncbi:hypothetical protein GCM10023210_12340 [Chryseobacterium ginsengisoli]|uniref:Bulb-type lectin domain-containing protein n=1 Tax=Chryseobacterium ginsengisoli TaxID=363853 RepID=A0ABP9LZD6_9FLAO